LIVVVLDAAGDDLEAGKSFYDSCEVGVGDYFVESLLADLHSMKLLRRHSFSAVWVLPHVIKAVQPIATLARGLLFPTSWSPKKQVHRLRKPVNNLWIN